MAEPTDDSYFRIICQHAGVALIATDEQLSIRFWNQAASRILGGSAETMKGRPLVSIVPADRRELAARLCERTLTRGDVGELEFQYHNPAGDLNYLAVTVSPIVDDSGRRAGVSVYLRDVTRRMELERSSADNQKMAALGVMAGQVAHHFNNVLGGIITSLDFVQDNDDPEALRRAIRSTVTALSRANRLTDGLLAFAEGDRSQCAMGNLVDVVRQYAADLRPKLEAQGIRLEVDMENFAGRVPSRRIVTVLEHLTANAREAMSDGGAIRIELKPMLDEPKAILRVADTGCGIDPRHLPHVFEPFYTTKCEAYNPEAHAGLGLAVVHGIVKEMGGSVALCSTPQGGTVCSVLLPVTVDHPQ